MARDLIYLYDGSFEGLLCCVFESYEKKEIPLDIQLASNGQMMLIPQKEIVTDRAKAERVAVSIPKKIGKRALEFVKRAFLTCLPKKERYILMFLRLGYRYGPSVMDMLADETVSTLSGAVHFLNHEAHLLTGFLRFSEYSGALVAEIEPKNFVLPLLAPHFCTRFPEERFLIYDRTHGAALVYRPYRTQIMPVEHFELPGPDEQEQEARELWRLYYKTIEVEGRHNPVCRRSHMPKRYWNCMTEFCKEKQMGIKKTPSPKSSGRGKQLPPICEL